MDSFIPSIPGLGSLGGFSAGGASGHQVKEGDGRGFSLEAEVGRDDTVSDFQLTIQAESENIPVLRVTTVDFLRKKIKRGSGGDCFYVVVQCPG